jgi:hypothetical protein
LFQYEVKGQGSPAKFPLYHVKLQEFNDPNNVDADTVFQFQITTKQKTMTLRAQSEEEFHSWLNAILKHKLLIEQIIDNIEL